MQRVRIIVCSLVGSLGWLATVLGLIAEANRIRPSQVELVGGQCFYSKTTATAPAFWAGFFAAVSLLLSQLVANTSGGCLCYCVKSWRNGSSINHNPAAIKASKRSIVAIVCLTVSWVVFANSFALLMEGALLNAPPQLYQHPLKLKDCYVVKQGVFAAGATLALLTSILAIIYYLAVTSDSSPAIVAALVADQNVLVPWPLDLEAATVRYPDEMYLIKPQI